MRESAETGQFLPGHRKREKKTPGKDANTSLALPEIELHGSPSQPSSSHRNRDGESRRRTSSQGLGTDLGTHLKKESQAVQPTITQFLHAHGREGKRSF